MTHHLPSEMNCTVQTKGRFASPQKIMEGHAQPRNCGIYLAVLGQVGQVWKNPLDHECQLTNCILVCQENPWKKAQQKPTHGA